VIAEDVLNYECVVVVQVDKAVEEANVFSLASHMWWGLWAILQVSVICVL
jgi:hypothetical protein